METLARRLAMGIKAVLLPFLLIGLVACEQLSGGMDTSLKTDIQCWEKEGICVTKQWRATGLIRGEKPELAELIVSLQWRNDCNPNPDWFGAKDSEMEIAMKVRQKMEKVGVEKLSDFELQSVGSKYALHIYRNRDKLDCGRIEIDLTDITLKDEHELQLYKHDLNQTIYVDPGGGKYFGDSETFLSENRTHQYRLSVPRVYLEEYKHLLISASLKRSWMVGMNKTP